MDRVEELTGLVVLHQLSLLLLLLLLLPLISIKKKKKKIVDVVEALGEQQTTMTSSKDQ